MGDVGDEDDEEEVNDLAAADDVANNDRANSTKRGYESKIRKMQTYAQLHVGEYGEVFSQYPLPVDFVKAFMGYAQVNPTTQKKRSASYVRGFISALKWSYSNEAIEIQPELDIWLTRFNKGHKRAIASAKQAGEMDQQEGKLGFSMTAYVYLANVFLKEYQTDTAYAHLFFVLSWNLMARGDAVARLKYDFMWWDNDMIVAMPPKNKADQAGEKIVGKHIAANPFSPDICPFIALARHVFSDGDREEYSDVFTRSAYEGFGHAFHAVVRAEGANAHLEIDPDKLGKHSTRKGSATYASSFPGGPGRDEICQRADWSLGGVRDRYIAPVNNGKDQFVARTLAGLDLGSVDFCVLPPHFSAADRPTVEDQLRGVLNVDAFPGSFRGCLLGLLASLANSIDFLEATLGPQDRLRSSRTWTSGTCV